MIIAYNNCPKLFKYLYVDGRPLEPSREVLIGRTFHKCAFELFERAQWERMEEMRTLEEVSRYLESLVQVDDPELKQYWRNFCRFEAAHYGRVKRLLLGQEFWFPVAKELRIELDDFFTKGIDRIDKMSDGTLMVIEYKCSEEMHVPTIRLETTFYALLLDWWGKMKPVTYIGCINPKLDQFWMEPVKRQTMVRLAHIVGKIKNAMETQQYPKNVTGRCRYCTFAQECLWEPVDVFKK